MTIMGMTDTIMVAYFISGRYISTSCPSASATMEFSEDSSTISLKVSCSGNSSRFVRYMEALNHAFHCCMA